MQAGVVGSIFVIILSIVIVVAVVVFAVAIWRYIHRDTKNTSQISNSYSEARF